MPLRPFLTLFSIALANSKLVAILANLLGPGLYGLKLMALENHCYLHLSLNFIFHPIYYHLQSHCFIYSTHYYHYFVNPFFLIFISNFFIFPPLFILHFNSYSIQVCYCLFYCLLLFTIFFIILFIILSIIWTVILSIICCTISVSDDIIIDEEFIDAHYCMLIC